MLRILVLFASIIYSLNVFAGECRVMSNAGELSFDSIHIGSLKRQVIMGKDYAVTKKSIYLNANCDNVNTFSVYYQAKNNGKVYNLDQGDGFYVLSIKSFKLNENERVPKYQDSKQVALQILPGKEVSVDNIQPGLQNLYLAIDLELFIDPMQSNNNISSSGEFVVHSY